MNAGQMYNEFEVAYEAIASGDAPGYQPYEVSILLSEAQDFIIKQLIALGVESDDKKALVLGPFIETSEHTVFGNSTMYPNTFTFEVDQTGYWALVNERLKETSLGATVDVKPIDHSFFSANVDNPFKKPDASRYYWRFIEQGATNAQWLVYGPTAIDTYYLSYLEAPTPIIVPGVTIGITIDGTTVDAGINTSGQDCVYNAIVHRDIIEKAAALGKAYIGDPQGLQLLKNN